MIGSTTSLGTLVVYIAGNASQYQRALKTVEASTEATMEQVLKSAKYGTAAVVATLAGIGAAGVREFSKFESSFAGVRKTIDATEAQYADLQQTFRNMALDIPVDVNEINGVAEAAGQLGIERKNLEGFTKTMIDLGNSTNLSANDAATQLARLANITQMPQTEFDRLGSTVVALGNNLATTEAEIVSMSLRLAGAGKQIGLSEDQIVSFAGALSSVGVEAEAGGTAMSQVMIRMSKAVATGSAELETFAAVAGMSVEDFTVAFEQDAASAIVTFLEGLKDVSDQGGDVFTLLENLGVDGVRLTDVLTRASGAGDLFRKSLELGSKAWEENSALTEEANKRYATLASQGTLLVNIIKDILITVGEGLAPVLLIVNDYIQESRKETGMWGDNVRGLSDIIKTGLLVGLNAVADVIAGWQVVIKGGQVLFASFFGFIALRAANTVGIVEDVIKVIIQGINKTISAYNYVAAKFSDKLEVGLIEFDGFDVAKGLYETAAAAGEARDALLAEFDAILAKGKPSETIMQRVAAAEKEAMDALRDGATDATTTTAELTAAVDETANAVNRLVASPSLVEFQQMTQDPLVNVLRDVDKLNKAVAESPELLDQYKRAVRDMISASNEFVAPVEGMSLFAGIDQADQFTQLANEEQLMADSYSRKLTALRDYYNAKKDVDETAAATTLALMQEMEQTYLNQQEMFQQKRLELILSTSQGIFDDLLSIAETFGGKQKGLYKVLFAASKAFAIADSIIKINQGIAAAAALPFPANLGAIASVVAATAGIVGNIQAVALSFEGGGHTGYGPRSGGLDGKGGFMAMLHPQERVIDEHKADAYRTGGGVAVSVNVTNQSGAAVDVRPSNDGRSIDILVTEVERRIAGNLDTGKGPVNRVMARRFNLRRT